MTVQTHPLHMVFRIVGKLLSIFLLKISVFMTLFKKSTYETWQFEFAEEEVHIVKSYMYVFPTAFIKKLRRKEMGKKEFTPIKFQSLFDIGTMTLSIQSTNKDYKLKGMRMTEKRAKNIGIKHVSVYKRVRPWLMILSGILGLRLWYIISANSGILGTLMIGLGIVYIWLNFFNLKLIYKIWANIIDKVSDYGNKFKEYRLKQRENNSDQV